MLPIPGEASRLHSLKHPAPSHWLGLRPSDERPTPGPERCDGLLPPSPPPTVSLFLPFSQLHALHSQQVASPIFKRQTRSVLGSKSSQGLVATGERKTVSGFDKTLVAWLHVRPLCLAHVCRSRAGFHRVMAVPSTSYPRAFALAALASSGSPRGLPPHALQGSARVPPHLHAALPDPTKVKGESLLD